MNAFNIRSFYDSLQIDPANLALACALALGSWVLMRGALALSRKKLGQLGEQQAHRPVAELLHATLDSTSGLAVAATALLIGLTALDLAPPWDERVRHLWFITLGLQLAIYINRAIMVGARRYFRSHAATPDAPDTVAHTLIIWTLQTALWVVFAIALLSNLGINVSTFVASLGIGGIAVALAVQNVLGDLFASLAIAVDKPFEVGDAISVAGFSGTVEHVGLKTTRVRADSGEQIVIANAELLKNTLRNFKRMNSRRVQFSLRVNPCTAPELAARIPEEIKTIIAAQPQVRFDRAHLKTMDQNWLEYEIVYHVSDPAYTIYMDRQQTIVLAIMSMLTRLDVSTSSTPVQVMVREPAAEKPALSLRQFQRHTS